MLKQSRPIKIIILSLLVSAVLLPAFYVLANPGPTEEREALEEELRRLEEEIARYEEDITKTEQEKKTLQNQIYSLRQTISKLNLQISQSNTNITKIGYQISDTEVSIEQTALKIEDSRQKLAHNLQLIYEEDQVSMLEVLLAEDKISSFFDNLVGLEILNEKSRELLKDIKNLKLSLEGEKENLDGEKTDLERMVQLKTLQKQESEKTQQQTDYYLQITETQYQEQLKQKQEVEKRAAEIRSRIFKLIGVPEAPTFGEALDIAKQVENITGVRPALLLAVLTQESNIGQNVGQCYLKNPSTGEGMVIYNNAAVSRVMKPTRDVVPFLEITGELGRDPYTTPVSCPMSFGYGGAMGPAQFIPSTWMIYRDRLKAITGRPADPWNIQDAFLAAAVYLADKGAGKRTYNYEWCAALSYFTGSCSLSNQIKYEFYGDSVMKIAAQYEEDIRDLGQAN